jgi:hypothetical protein
MNAVAESSGRRGTELLLAHCAVPPRMPASERLNAALGADLSRRLVAALARDQRGERRLRGSSSPYTLT